MDLFGDQTISDIEKINEIAREKSMKIGFTCSAADCLHSGHVLMLEDARKQCDFLVFALQTDPTIDRNNKNRPVQTWDERYTMLSGIKYIDYIMKYSTEKDLYMILQKLRPDVRIIGSDWRGKLYTGHDLEFIPVYWHERTHNYSTTSLRERIFDAEVNRYMGKSVFDNVTFLRKIKSDDISKLEYMTIGEDFSHLCKKFVQGDVGREEASFPNGVYSKKIPPVEELALPPGIAWNIKDPRRGSYSKKIAESGRTSEGKSALEIHAAGELKVPPLLEYFNKECHCKFHSRSSHSDNSTIVREFLSS